MLPDLGDPLDHHEVVARDAGGESGKSLGVAHAGSMKDSETRPQLELESE